MKRIFLSLLLLNVSTCFAISLTSEQIKQKANQQAIEEMNAQLNLHVHSIEDIKPAITQLYIDYFAKLRQCTTGTYKYALPSPTGGTYNPAEEIIVPLYYFPTTLIQGWQNDKCAVYTSYEIYGIGEVEIQCQFKRDSLKVFTDAEAKFTVNGNLDSVSPASRTNMEQCQLLINGDTLAGDAENEKK